MVYYILLPPVYQHSREIFVQSKQTWATVLKLEWNEKNCTTPHWIYPIKQIVNKGV